VHLKKKRALEERENFLQDVELVYLSGTKG
jgi:hypothetical protein